MQSAHVRSITDGEAGVSGTAKGRTSCWDPILGSYRRVSDRTRDSNALRRTRRKWNGFLLSRNRRPGSRTLYFQNDDIRQGASNLFDL